MSGSESGPQSISAFESMMSRRSRGGEVRSLSTDTDSDSDLEGSMVLEVV